MGESRNKYLIKNIVIFTIGNIGSRMISFFLIPLYTNILSTAQYGTVDLITTISTVAGPILTLNIFESVMRFGLDKNANKEKITQIGSIIYFIAAIIGIGIIPICSVFNQISYYSIYVYLYVFSLAASQLFLCDLRGKELLLQYSVGNILQTFLIAVLNICFLFVFKLEIKGYLLAYIIAYFITAIYAIIIGKGYKSFRIINLDIIKMKEMIRYSIVLIPNTLMWWIMNSSDRIMVTGMIGAEANGIYAISYKLPTLASALTSVFNQAWSYSAIQEEGAEDENEFNNKVFKQLITVAMLIGIGLLAISKPFLKIYVADEYYKAWKYTPFLIVGCVYLTLGTFMSTSYAVHKDSFGYLFSGTFGAFFNIALNFILIPVNGVYGAAIATCISYIAVFIFRVFHTRKYLQYDLKNREFIVGTLLLVLCALFMYIDNIYGMIIQLLLFVLSIVTYNKNWRPMLRIIMNKLGKR